MLFNVVHLYSSNTLSRALALMQVRFRLTRMGTCPHVTDLLLDASGPLQPLHTRVLEAGCEVNPSWKLGCPSWRDSGGCCTFKLNRALHVPSWTFSRGQVKLYSTPIGLHTFAYSSLTYFSICWPFTLVASLWHIPA